MPHIVDSPTVSPSTSIDSLNGSSQKLSDYLPPLEGSSIVPPAHYGRTLVLCFDGTGDQFDRDNSNIVDLFTLLKKDDRKKQMVYYQAGIGTYTSPQMVTPFMSKVSKTLDEAIAWNLDAHIMGGYEFLMQNYSEGDRICIFGFSRGAYTARCLAGMIHKVGILPACNHQQVPFAYKMYSDPKYNVDEAKGFKRAFSTDVDIEFLGVWDTVESVGIIPRELPFTGSNSIVRTFRHALSLDERRAKFKAKTYYRNEEDSDDEDACTHDYSKDEMPKKHKPKGLKKALKHQAKNGDEKLMIEALKEKYSKDRKTNTNAKEVWFSGCHCDVGGGSVDNATKYNLARIPLRWMIRECFRTNSGIMFNAKLLRDMLGMEPTELYPEVVERPKSLVINPDIDFIQRREDVEPGFFSWLFGSGQQRQTQNGYQHLPSSSESTLVDMSNRFDDEEQRRELVDLLSPIYDQLSISRFWWSLEVIPLFVKAMGPFMDRWRVNWGRGRVIPVPQPGPGERVLVHRSVRLRLEAADKKGNKYEPNAENWKELVKNIEENIEWVD